MDPTTLLVTQFSETLYEMLKEKILSFKMEAHSKLTFEGVIPKPGDESIEFESIIGRFVTCNLGFKKELKTLKETVSRYSERTAPKRPLNILLVCVMMSVNYNTRLTTIKIPEIKN